jgi:hypothetical protein
MWDGWAYAECAVDSATNRFALYFLRCYGHPAYVYSGLLAAAQLLDLGNPVLLFLVNGLVLAAATVGFHRLMRRAFPGEAHATDIALLTAAFLLQPPFLASVLQPALDLPVLAGTIWCTVLLIERRSRKKPVSCCTAYCSPAAASGCSRARGAPLRLGHAR